MAAQRKCWCGCRKAVKGKSRFLPGHDAKFHSKVLRVARGTLGITEATRTMPADAKAAFREAVKEAKKKVTKAKKTPKKTTKAAKKTEKKTQAA